jgi:quercetin dioxygenase-like cupin family protein
MTKKENLMWFVAPRRVACVALALTSLVWLGAVRAGEVDPKAAAILLPDHVKWVESRNGASASAILYGDPAKEGLYIELMKWHPHHNSMPHSHPHDRVITVLSGTWWIGTGANYDMNSTVPVKPGSVVTHFANQLHYDGAKDEDCVLEIVGMGPANGAPAPK